MLREDNRRQGFFEADKLAAVLTHLPEALRPVIRFAAMPKFDFQIIDRKDQAAVGAGEVLITNVPAAVANAIFDATGKRLRQLPFTPTRVRAALTV